MQVEFNTISIPLSQGKITTKSSLIMRQNVDIVDKSTGHRKTKEGLCMSQFEDKTRLCRGVIMKAIQALMAKDLICRAVQSGKHLPTPSLRKGNNIPDGTKIV